MNHDLTDIDGRRIELGHILAVRYVWNSYVGEVTLRGLFVGHTYHLLRGDGAHYQIIGHADEAHPDYRKDVSDWLAKYYSGNYPECPVRIRVYENVEC